MEVNFETPFIWTPGISLDEVEFEIDQMIDRAYARDAWLDGQISTSDFLDLLHDQDIDVFDLVDCWENQIILV